MRPVIALLLAGLLFLAIGIFMMGDREGLLIRGSSFLGAALIGLAFARLVWVVWRRRHRAVGDIHQP